MTRRWLRRTFAALLVVASTGCTGASGGAGAALTSRPTAPTGMPVATATGTAAAATTPPAATASSGSAEASSGGSPDGPRASGQVPAATLVAAGKRHPGEAGSWVWAQQSSDSPWLPAQALARASVPRGTVTVELDARVGVESWAAVAAVADDTHGVAVEPVGDGSGKPSFHMAAGDWVVAVHVRFSRGLGSAVYYWHLVVT
jgi:hypothetical protein